MSQNEQASIYMAYSNLREDQKKPTAAQVQKGYIEDKERVVYGSSIEHSFAKTLVRLGVHVTVQLVHICQSEE